MPVASFLAVYEGISPQDGSKLDEETFSGHVHTIQIAEGARIILTQNLHVSSGLMNGTQGTVVAIVYGQGSDLNHPNPAYRMPAPTCT